MQTFVRELNAVPTPTPTPPKKQVSVFCVFAGPTRHRDYWALLYATDTPTVPILTNVRFCYICILVAYDCHNKHQYLSCVWLSKQTPIFVFRMTAPLNTSICVSYCSHNRHQYLCLYHCNPILKKQIFVFRMSIHTRICVLYDSHNKHLYLSLHSIKRFDSIVKVICHAVTASLYNSQEYESL